MSDKALEECVATGQACSYKKETIPSEFITGMAGGVPFEVVQCKYCGKTKEDNDE